MSSNAERYRIPEDELHEDLQPLTELNAVDKIIEYQSPYADYSILLTETGRVQNVRVYYLEELCGLWEWVDGTDDGVGFVLLSKRGERR